MFNLTQDEKRVVLFLIFAAWAGLGIKFAAKINPRIEKTIKIAPDSYLIKININQATQQDLKSLARLSPKLAQGIIAYRLEKNGFKNLEELKEVKGIGEYRYEKLKEYFYVQ